MSYPSGFFTTQLRSCVTVALFCAVLVTAGAARAEKMSNSIAEFSGLDKITGRIISFDVYIDETVQFGALQVTPRICYTRPLSEAPQTTSFVEVDEITLDNKVQRIFTGWMFAASPGLHAVEHGVYDVWLTDCKTTTNVPPPPGSTAAAAAAGNGDATATGSTTADGMTAQQSDAQLPPTVPRPKPRL